MPKDPELLTHLEWLGYLQPVGLVVSPPALVAAQAFPAKNIIPSHSRFLEIVEQRVLDGETDPRPVVQDLPRFATQILGWEPRDVVGTNEGGPVPETLEVALPPIQRFTSPDLCRSRVRQGRSRGAQVAPADPASESRPRPR